MIEALEINPLDSDHWLYATGLTVYGGHDLTKWDTVHNVSIQSLAVGIEEMAVLGLASAPGGSELLAAVGDDCGFTFKTSADLGTSPKTPWMTPMWTSSTDVDYAGNKPANVVRIGNGSGSQQVAVSSDGGASWNIHYGTDTSKNSGTVAYSADADTIVWSSGNAGVVRSSNQGTFTAVASLPSGAVIASDKRNNTVFYAGSTTGTFYRSTDIGATFTAVSGALGSAKSVRDIVAHPTTAGELYVSTDVGIFRSTNFGASFSQLSGVSNTQSISLGVGSSAGKWNLYAFGTGANGNKLYASADAGATWTDVQGAQGFGSISANKVVGSGNVAGQVYVGTNGRGVLYAQVSVSGGSSPVTTTSAVKASSTALPVTTTTTSKATTTLVTSTVKTTSSSSSSVKTTSITLKVSSTSSAAAPTGTNLAQRWAQCGGIGYTGPTVCVAPYTCQKQNDYYSQCL